MNNLQNVDTPHSSCSMNVMVMEWMNKNKKSIKTSGEMLFLKKKFPTEMFFLAFGSLCLRSLIGNICAAVSSPLKLIGLCSGCCLSVYGRSSLLIFGVLISHDSFLSVITGIPVVREPEKACLSCSNAPICSSHALASRDAVPDMPGTAWHTRR